ncbi:MAG: ParA family protein [Bdellovibrionales bacterium]|nr:ParA family protein [Bdellovibrionales bacterium]
MPKIISIFNQKGGVGKTTTVINLGASLALLNKKVLLIDMDPQGNLSCGLAVNPDLVPDQNIYLALVGAKKLHETIIPTAVPNLFVCPADTNLAGAEVELVELSDREYRLKLSFTEELSSFDYVLIDCPPSLGLLTLNALTASTSYLVPMQSEFFSLQGFASILNTVELVKAHLNPELKEEGILLTMFDSRSKLSKQVLSEIRGFAKDRIFSTIIPRRIRLAESTSHGTPGIVYDPACFGAKSYLEVAKELILRSQGIKVAQSAQPAIIPPDPVDRFSKKNEQKLEEAEKTPSPSGSAEV